MPHSRRLIVGLGNPGAEYEGTRHNVGFMVIDALAEEKSVRLEHDRDALVGKASHRSFPFDLVKPLTYVNRSGEAVRRLARARDLSPGEILVIVDDIHLAPGTLRLRPGGGSGGHNGLDDIIARLGTDAFPRLRLGIGNDFPRGGMVDYVLSPFTADERPFIEEAVERACQAALAFVTEGVEEAMNRFN